jgi:autotransporter translocation and assembly factor TamB
VAGGVWVWVRTPPGQRFVLGQLHDAAPGVTIDAERVSGSLFSDVRLERVTARLCDKGLVVHARGIEARYRLVSLLTGEPRLTVIVDAPRIEPGERSSDCAGGPPRRAHLERLVVRDGSFGPFSDIEVEGRVADGSVDLEWRLVADELPALRGQVEVTGHARGPLEAIDLGAVARTSSAPIRVSGTVNATSGAADLEVALERLALDPPSSAVTLIATATARVRVVAGKLSVRARGDYRRREEKLSEELPGGSFVARAEGTARRGRLHADFDIDLDDAGQAARQLEGRDAPSSSTRVRGSLVVPPRGRARLTADVLARGQ